MAVIEYKKGSTDASAVGSYYGGALPVDTDTLRFSEGAGTFNVQTTTAIAGVTLAACVVSEGCSVQIGDESNPLRVDITDLQIFGRGPKFYFRGGTDAGVITTILYNPMNGTAALYLDALANTTMRVFSGTVVVPSSTTLATVEVDGPGVVIAQEHASDVITGGHVTNGGTLIARRAIRGTFEVGEGGTLIYDVDTTDTTTGGTMLVRLLGGRVEQLKGSMVLDYMKGTHDYSRLQKTGYTNTFFERSGVIETIGGVIPTYARTTYRPSKKLTV